MSAATFPVEINGQTYQVCPSELTADYTLNDYIREHALLKGTKAMCKEGGCGICTVTVQYGSTKPHPVNSCLVPINTCNGWKVTTIEGLGNERTGYNKIQESLADNNGSQCGYCSPGMVMTMYGKAQQAPEDLPAKLEGTFDGNICRCTGYRAIMYAMDQCVSDIEDITRCKNCPNAAPQIPRSSVSTWSTASGSNWYSPSSLDQLTAIISQHATDKYYLVSGHTGVGVYKDDGPFSAYIDVKLVPELSAVAKSDSKVTIGASVSLTQLMTTFQQVSSASAFSYLTDAVDYLDQVANLQIRNMGSWAGNLMMKQKHNDFISDVFILLEAIGAKLTICDCQNNNSQSEISVSSLLSLDMSGKLILNMNLEPRDGWTLRCYKIMPRYRNAHSMLSLAFFVNLDKDMTVTEKPSVLYAGVSADFVHAADIENMLLHKSLFSNDTLQDCMGLLEKIACPEDPMLPSVEFRKSMLKSLFYKAVLSMNKSQCPPDLASGADVLVRPATSKGTQSFPTDPKQYPMTQPIPKLTSRKQTAGEAQFIGDVPEMVGQLHAVFVKSTIGSGKISSVDSSEALKIPGVVKVLTSKDVPGQNVITTKETFLCDTDVDYCGQPVAIVVAETEEQAMAARDKVKVTYSNEQTPILNISQAISSKSFHPTPQGNVLKKGDAKGALKDCDTVVTGTIETLEQYPMHTETQICLVDPQEGNYIIHSSTQIMGMVQTSAAGLLGIGSNEVEVRTRRVGGGFGAKQSRSVYVSNGAALAAYHTQRPVLMRLTLEDNMEMLGRRQPWRIEYQAGVNKKDMKVQALVATLYENCGFYTTDALGPAAYLWIDNAYYIPNWDLTTLQCKTNQPNHSYIRAPGIISVSYFAEQILNDLADKLQASSEQVKEVNFYQDGQMTPMGVTISPCLITDIWNSLKTSTDFVTRSAAIDVFNKGNMWRKKAISMTPLKYNMAWFPGTFFTVHVSINYGDGAVTVTHGGVELGQGINTKAIQVAAHALGVPVDNVKVNPTSTSYNVNSSVTGGSITSDMNCFGVQGACDLLIQRMAPYKTEGKSWTDVVTLCKDNGVDLHAKYFVTPKDIDPNSTKSPMQACDVFGAACTEVELDVLTGKYLLNRMDVLYDCGTSYSPDIDIGQIEGAIVMSLGLLFHEEVKYDTKSGQLLTNNTWTYHVPLNRDIPVDLRIDLLKNKPNEKFKLRSKIVGEPPLILTASAVTAMRKCIAEVRSQQGRTGPFTADVPLTVEKIHVQCGLDSTKFVVK